MAIRRNLKNKRTLPGISINQTNNLTIVPNNMPPPEHVFYPHLQPLNHTNFDSIVLKVTLDNENNYIGQSHCKICNLTFNQNTDTRVLRCEHAFHGPCIYQFMIVQNQNLCPVCSVVY